MKLNTLNILPEEEAFQQLLNCCGANNWARQLLKYRPFKNEKQLYQLAEACWYQHCSPEDWLQAFKHHPKIGDIKSLEKKFANTKHWAGKEQSGVQNARLETLEALAKGNEEYEQKFGYIFIVCATGKSADEMLQILQKRLANTADLELKIAMGEQHKITNIRIAKLLTQDKKMSQITTHVLDTSIGKPGQGILIKLQQSVDGEWKTLGKGTSNDDGRVTDLLKDDVVLSPGTYRMWFDTGSYFKNQGIKAFYPEVGIQFTVFDDAHYHVPLLLNPYGYSTYRGS